MQQKISELKPWLKLWKAELPPLSDFECTTFEYIMAKNAGHEDDIALNYFDRRITFREFFRNVEDTAKAYTSLGVKKDDIITLVSVMTPETIYTFYAMSYVGAVLNMADPRTSPAGLHEYISEAHSKVVVVLSDAYDKMREAVVGTEVEKVIVVSPADSLGCVKKALYRLTKPDKRKYDDNVIFWPDFIKRKDTVDSILRVRYNPDHAALIVHTGGTTGKPKGVLLGAKALNALAYQMSLNRFHRQERFLNIMPPFIAYGYGSGVHTPLSAGAEVILIPAFDPAEFGKLLNKYHPEHTAGVPLHYQNLLTDKAVRNTDLSWLISTGSGGDAISKQAEEDVNAFLKAHHAPYPLCKGYGMTEVSAGVATSMKEINRAGSVGIPLALITVGIFEPGTENELGFNEEGEVCVTGPNNMLGYYEMPEETANVMRRHSDGLEWVHTGDVGYMDEDGYLYIVNRLKRVIIRHDGFKIFPFVIENAIGSVEGVDAAYAVAIKDPDHAQGLLPHVFLRKKADCTISDDELIKKVRATCEKEIPEYCLPYSYSMISDVPYTKIGKIDYIKLAEMAANRQCG